MFDASLPQELVSLSALCSTTCSLPGGTREFVVAGAPTRTAPTPNSPNAPGGVASFEWAPLFRGLCQFRQHLLRDVPAQRGCRTHQGVRPHMMKCSALALGRTNYSILYDIRRLEGSAPFRFVGAAATKLLTRLVRRRRNRSGPCHMLELGVRVRTRALLVRLCRWLHHVGNS